MDVCAVQGPAGRGDRRRARRRSVTMSTTRPATGIRGVAGDAREEGGGDVRGRTSVLCGASPPRPPRGGARVPTSRDTRTNARGENVVTRRGNCRLFSFRSTTSLTGRGDAGRIPFSTNRDRFKTGLVRTAWGGTLAHTRPNATAAQQPRATLVWCRPARPCKSRRAQSGAARALRSDLPVSRRRV